MNTRRSFFSVGRAAAVALLVLAVLTGATTPVQAQAKKRNPSSKVYFAEVHGDAMIDTGEVVDDLARRSVYNAQGTIIETKKADKSADGAKAFSTMVYSNGTGAFFDADTRVELKQFVQEPFTPNRTDMETEPSISQTSAFISRGTVGLCTSKLVAGSKMTYQTALGAVNVRGRKVVIEATNEVTKISMLEGESTVRAGSQELGGHTLRAGEQAVIRRGAAGQPNQIQISRIPPQETPELEDKVSMACKAKKTVYFEVRERPAGSIEAASEVALTEAEKDATGETITSGPVDAFDGNSASNATTVSAGRTTQVIVPVEVVSPNLPVQNQVSPDYLHSRPSR
ncbi:MAG TPA: hypothetical protein VM029_02425 [Opitutaceae bacterium]|nr:hypothetical protein [Opitutaceae bacterium]